MKGHSALALLLAAFCGPLLLAACTVSSGPASSKDMVCLRGHDEPEHGWTSKQFVCDEYRPVQP